MDINSLDRFVCAQEKIYAVALAELGAGRKRSHWMWYVFPQLRGLGRSAASYFYGIAGTEEARAYLAHPILSERLVEASEVLLRQENNDPEEIFGITDALKLRSSMTLFALVSDSGSVFHRVLARFFDGRPDARTAELIEGTTGMPPNGQGQMSATAYSPQD